MVKRAAQKTMPLLRRQLYLAAVLIPPLLAVLKLVDKNAVVQGVWMMGSRALTVETLPALLP